MKTQAVSDRELLAKVTDRIRALHAAIRSSDKQLARGALDSGDHAEARVIARLLTAQRRRVERPLREILAVLDQHERATAQTAEA